MAQLRCSNCGGLFTGGNCLSCSIVGYGNEFVHDTNPLPYDLPTTTAPYHNPSQFFISLDGDDEDDDYDKESIISTNTDIFKTPSSIVITTSPLILPIEDPDVSLIIGNEELNTIPEKESDEFIKSSVEDLIPIPSDDVEHLLHHDPSIPKMSIASILEGFTNEPPLEENDDLFDLEPNNGDWKKILYDAPILMTKDKKFDPRIHDQNFSPTYVSLPFEDRHYLFFTYVI
nr:hypothetical protein [Tanacetum cinerariifolium]